MLRERVLQESRHPLLQDPERCGDVSNWQQDEIESIPHFPRDLPCSGPDLPFRLGWGRMARHQDRSQGLSTLVSGISNPPAPHIGGNSHVSPTVDELQSPVVYVSCSSMVARRPRKT